MSWQFTVYFLPLFAAVCGSFLLGVIAWWHREYRYAKTIVILMLAVTWWSLAYVFGIGTTSPAIKRLAYSLAYPAISVVSIAWFVFAIQYTGRLRVPTRKELAVLGVIPLLTTIAAFTNQHHGLVWSSVSIVSEGNLKLMSTTHGTLFWVQLLQSYTLVGVGTAFIFEMAVLSDDIYRSQAVSLSLAAVFPLLMNLLYLIGFTNPVDLTPAAFSLSGALLISSVYRDQLLQSLPLARELARDELIEQMTSAVIVVDKRERVVDFNPAAEPLAEITAAEAIGAHIETAFPAITEGVDTLDRSPCQTEVTKTDGETERYYEIETIPLHRGYGTVTGHLVTVNDITERKQSEQNLDRERQFIDQALNTLDDVFYVVGTDGTLRRWNDRLPEVTGYSDEEIAEMNAAEFFSEDDRGRISEAIKETLETGHVALEAEYLTADGTRLPYEFTGARMTDPNGELSGLVGIGRDISERKDRERRLRTFQEAVENAGHAIYWTDEDGTIEYVNPTFEEQTGYSATEAIGETPSILDSGVQSEAFHEKMWDTIQAGGTWEAEFVNRRKNGERYIVNQSITPVSQDGDISRYVAVATDITERYHREQQLSVLQRVLRHDLRNNLNEIVLATQLLRRELDESESFDQLDAIQQAVEATLSLTRKIRELRTVFEEEENYTKELDVVERTRTQVSSIQTERQNVTFTVDLPPEAYAVTNELFDEAIRNVFQNAIEHNDTETPEIEVTLERRQKDKEIVLRIADNGPGIPQREIEVLESDQEGQLQHLSGFGLWLVKWVVYLSGGELEFEENEPRGTVVKLIMPAGDHDRGRP